MVDLLRGRALRAPVLALAFPALTALGGAGCAGGRSGAPDPASGSGVEEGAPPEAGDPAAVAARRAAVDRLVRQARALLAVGDTAGAASELERAVRRDPAHGPAYLELARIRAGQGRIRTARGLLERAALLLRGDTTALARLDSLRAALEAREGATRAGPRGGGG